MIRFSTKFFIVHCSATRADQDINAKTIDAWHKAQGYASIGYHFVIKRDGNIETGRPVNAVGAHCKGWNSVSIGICMVGGADIHGRGEENFTSLQFDALKELIERLRDKFPKAAIRGHRDFSPDKNGDGKITPNEFFKSCPSFNTVEWCNNNFIDPR